MKRFYKNVLVVVLDDGGDAFQVFLRVSQSSIKKELYYVGLKPNTMCLASLLM